MFPETGGNGRPHFFGEPPNAKCIYMRSDNHQILVEWSDGPSGVRHTLGVIAPSGDGGGAQGRLVALRLPAEQGVYQNREGVLNAFNGAIFADSSGVFQPTDSSSLPKGVWIHLAATPLPEVSVMGVSDTSKAPFVVYGASVDFPCTTVDGQRGCQ